MGDIAIAGLLGRRSLPMATWVTSSCFAHDGQKGGRKGRTDIIAELLDQASRPAGAESDTALCQNLIDLIDHAQHRP